MTGNAPSHETQVAYHRRRAIELQAVRSLWETDWRALAEFIEPSRLRIDKPQEGSISRKSIIDSTGTFALRTLQSGMHSGITSPARPWFRLTTFDPDMKDFAPVKEYLASVEMRMREVFQESNVYRAFHAGYGDLGQFGQSCGILIEDDDAQVRMQQLTHGTFWIARDTKGRVTTMYRCFTWSAQRIVARFGRDKVSHRIREAYDQSKYDQTYKIWHAIEPREKRDASKQDKPNKPFLSNYWEDGRNEGGLLEESGFDENPLIAPAWELTGDDHYAIGPGYVALGDIKMLQLEQRRKLEAIDKIVRPPMTGPTSMRNNPASILPGALTFADDTVGGKGFRPAMEVNLRLSELAQDIRDTQERINRAFYADLFLMLAQMEGIQPRNQFEIAERKEEKLLALGPVLENIYNDQLAPVISRAFNILNRRRQLPPPPPDLEGQPLQIEYISMLAQAQKAISTGGIERGAAFVGQLASVKPDVLDKFDADEAVDQYFDALGVAPSIVVPDEEVAKVRQARAQKQAAAENAEMMSQVAPAAKAGAEAASVLAGAGENPGGAALLQRLGIG